MIKYILVIVLFLFSQVATAFSYTVEITEPELQEKVSKIMPLVKKKFFVTVTLTEPKVDLQTENNNITVFLRIEVTAPGGIKGTGELKVSGSLLYEPNNYEFFLKDPVLNNMVIDKVPDKYMPKIKSMSQQMVTKVLAKKPVYKLKDDNLKHQLAKSLLQSITVKDKTLYLVLGF